MGSAGIGRLLTASLHQAITELLPARVPFYEPWVSADGLRGAGVSLAGIRAAFSFLRREDGAYDDVMRRAGELAAAWTWHEISAVRRAWLRALPMWARRRAALGLAGRLASDTWRDTRVRTRWRRGDGTLTVAPSIFCDVRGAVRAPLCRYYAAALTQFLQLLGVDAGVEHESCLATGGETCVLAVRGTPGPATTIVGALLLLVLLVTAGSAAAQSVAPSMRDRVLVVPFENLGRDPRLSWIGEGAAILLTDQIRAAGTDALTRVERLRIFERLQVPPLAALSHATVIRIGQLVGASDVVTGDITRDGDDLIIKARRICLDAGVLEPEIVERAGALDVMQAFGRVGRRLLEGTRGSEPSANGDLDGGPPLAAFEQYVKGLLAGTPANQTAFLQNALRAHPAYDAARLALWQVQTAAGDHRAAIETVRPVGDASPLAIDAGFLRSQSLLSLGQDAAAADELQRLQARVPSPVFLNNLGVVALRDPSLTARLGHPAWYFGRARTLDALDADYVFNLGYAYLVDGDPEGASYWLKECVRLTPTDGAAHALLAQTLFASGAPTEAGRELALAKRLSSAFDALELRAGTAPPRGLERLKDTLDPLHARRIDAAFEMVGQRDQQALARFYLERGRRLADKELDRDAEAELTRALYLSPYNAEAHLLLGRIFLRTGRPRQAIDAVKISLWSEETAAAHLVLAEAYLEIHDDAVARAEAERALTLDPNSIQARRLIERLAK